MLAYTGIQVRRRPWPYLLRFRNYGYKVSVWSMSSKLLNSPVLILYRISLYCSMEIYFLNALTLDILILRLEEVIEFFELSISFVWYKIDVTKKCAIVFDFILFPICTEIMHANWWTDRCWLFIFIAFHTI